MDKEEQIVFQVVPSLQPIADIELTGLKEMFSYECQVAKLELLSTANPPSKVGKKRRREYDKVIDTSLKYLVHFYDQKKGTLTIDNTLTSISIQGKDIAKWTIEDKDQVQEVNLGTAKNFTIYASTRILN